MERNELYDFYKALLMFGVVWGHAITSFGGGDASCNITWFLRLYDMPFFMLISGYFLHFSVQKYNFRELLLNKVTTILLPTVFWGFILSRGDLFFTGYYFLYAVFFSSVAVILIERICRPVVLKWLIYTALILTLYVIDKKPFNLCYLFPFFLLGYKNDKWYKEFKWGWFLFLLLGICFWKSSYNIWNSDTNVLHGFNVILINIYRLLIGCAAIATMRVVFDMAFSYFKENNPSFINQICKTIGRETFGLYISHVFALALLKVSIRFMQTRLGYNIFLKNDRLLVYIIAPTFAVLTLFLCYKAIALCKKNKYLKYLWGFKLSLSNHI